LLSRILEGTSAPHFVDRPLGGGARIGIAVELAPTEVSLLAGTWRSAIGRKLVLREHIVFLHCITLLPSWNLMQLDSSVQRKGRNAGALGRANVIGPK
jgi:hypothetical protein